MKIIGSYVSPYVRKVLACMALKGLDDYEIDPLTPFFGSDDFERLYFEHHIAKASGNMSRVAENVQLERTHLYRKLKQLGIRIKQG